MDHRRSVREGGVPSDNVWVGFGPWQGTPIIAVAEAVLKDVQGRAPDFEAYVVVLAFLKVAFKVVGFTSDPPPHQVIGGANASITQFWPKEAGIAHWPPPGPPATNMTLAALLNFVPLRRV
jgi:hypothetical protein